MHTKIIPTFSIDTEDIYVKRLTLYKELGIKVIRLNLTRYSLGEYAIEINKLKNVQKKLWGKQCIDIMLDVPFPGTKSRIKFDGCSREVFIQKNDLITITDCEDKMSVTKNIFFVENIKDLKLSEINECIEIDDGRLKLVVISKDENSIKLQALNNAKVHYMKSINRSGKTFFMEEREEYIRDLASLISNTATNMVCFSFVETEEQMQTINQVFGKKDIYCVPKIETLRGIENLNRILKYCNIAMLGRGDLALTSGIHIVGVAQEHFINTCKKNNTAIIIATDIMNSVVEFSVSTPLRSDLVDIDNLIHNSVDYVVTSGPMANSAYLKDFCRLITDIRDVRNERLFYEKRLLSSSRYCTHSRRT